jgi:hypothetical protein
VEKLLVIFLQLETMWPWMSLICKETIILLAAQSLVFHFLSAKKRATEFLLSGEFL